MSCHFQIFTPKYSRGHLIDIKKVWMHDIISYLGKPVYNIIPGRKTDKKKIRQTISKIKDIHSVSLFFVFVDSLERLTYWSQNCFSACKAAWSFSIQKYSILFWMNRLNSHPWTCIDKGNVRLRPISLWSHCFRWSTPSLTGGVYNQLIRAMKYIKHACTGFDGVEADDKAVEEWKLFFARESIISNYMSVCRLISDKCPSNGMPHLCFWLSI